MSVIPVSSPSASTCSGAILTPFTGGGVHELSSMFARPPGSGPPTLLRVNNANYFPTMLRFVDADGAEVRMAEIIGHDGRAFRDTSDPTGPSRPVSVRTARLAFGSAERYDLLLRPRAPESSTRPCRLDPLDHPQAPRHPNGADPGRVSRLPADLVRRATGARCRR
jgi:hypothetical protein